MKTITLVATPDELIMYKYTRKWAKNQGLAMSYEKLQYCQPIALMRMCLLFEEIGSCGMINDQGQGEQHSKQATEACGGTGEHAAHTTIADSDENNRDNTA